MSNAKPLTWEQRVERWADLGRAATPRQRRIFMRAAARQQALLLSPERPGITKASGLPVRRPLADQRRLRSALAASRLHRMGWNDNIAIYCGPGCARHARPRLHTISREHLARITRETATQLGAAAVEAAR